MLAEEPASRVRPSATPTLDAPPEVAEKAAREAQAARGTHDGGSVDPMIGRVLLGQFVVRGRLGQGGMGAVYLADQPAVERRVVVKVLRPELSRGREALERFNIEARAASRLAHPNIVTVHNYG